MENKNDLQDDFESIIVYLLSLPMKAGTRELALPAKYQRMVSEFIYCRFYFSIKFSLKCFQMNY